MPKHKPQRTCLACREVQEKKALIRIVRTPEKRVLLDSTGKANGRGVYLCRRPECLEKGLKKERLSYALKVPVTPEDIEAIRGALQAELSNIKGVL